MFNLFKTAVLMAAITALFMAVGAFVGGQQGMMFALVVAIGLNFFSYWFSDKLVLKMYNAREVDASSAPQFYSMIAELAQKAGLPMPRVYVIEEAAPNAFATGRNPEHAAIAVTTGLLEKMNRVELEGVLAHELSHIKNYDILISTVAVVAVGAITLISELGLRFMWFGGRRDRRDNIDSGPVGVIIALAAMALLVVAPFAALLMQFALSRKRELLADARGVSLTRYPPGLISALKKLQEDQTVVHQATRATAQLWIESPLDREPGHKGSKLNSAFDTHPPLAERIAILEAM